MHMALCFYAGSFFSVEVKGVYFLIVLDRMGIGGF